MPISSYVCDNHFVVTSDLLFPLHWYFQAKALAEKNMRDLLAQKEQAERNVILPYITCALVKFIIFAQQCFTFI